MSDPELNEAESGEGRTLDGRRVIAAFRESDAALVVGLMLAIYAAFILIGVLLHYDISGQVRALYRLTFLTAVYALVVLALNLHWGYTGLFNIGVAGFMAVGTYTMAMATAAPDATVPGLGLPFWAGIVLGMIAASIVGLIAALPALRLKDDYLAITTIAFSEIIRMTYLSSSLQKFTLFGTKLGTGGGRGIGIDPKPDTHIVEILTGIPVIHSLYGAFSGALQGAGVVPNVVNNWVYAIFLLVCVAAFYWLLQRVGHSPFGRVLKAIREDEDVARALGKNTRMFKIKSFMLGCALMGLAGVLWKGTPGFINPNTFLPQVTFFVWIALIIGGSGSNTGGIIGSALFAAVLFEGPRYLKNVITQYFQLSQTPNTFAAAVHQLTTLMTVNLGPFPVIGSISFPFINIASFFAYALDNLDPLRLVFVGIVLIWLMQNRPEGLLGHRKDTASSVDLSRPTATPPAATDGGEDE